MEKSPVTQTRANSGARRRWQFSARDALIATSGVCTSLALMRLGYFGVHAGLALIVVSLAFFVTMGSTKERLSAAGDTALVAVAFGWIAITVLAFWYLYRIASPLAFALAGLIALIYSVLHGRGPRAR